MDGEPGNQQPTRSMNIQASGSHIPVPKRWPRSSQESPSLVEKSMSVNPGGRSMSDGSSSARGGSHIPIPVRNPNLVPATPPAGKSPVKSSPKHLPAPGYYSRFKEVVSPSKESSKQLSPPSSNASPILPLTRGNQSSMPPASTVSPVSSTPPVSVKSPASIKSPVSVESPISPNTIEAGVTPDIGRVDSPALASPSDSVNANIQHSGLPNRTQTSPTSAPDTSLSQLKKVAPDSDVKRNLLSMLSKSEERRKKPRVLPSLEAVSPTRSPTKRALPLSPTDKVQSQESSSISPVIEATDDSTTPIPHLPVEEMKPEKPRLKPALHLPVDEMTAEMPALSPPEPTFSVQPNMESVVQKLDSLGMYNTESAEGSITAFQPLEESSSPSESGGRNLMSISAELEDKEASQLHGVSEDSITGSGDSFASHKSMPTNLGDASGSVNPLVSLEAEEISSLPDLPSQFSEETANQRWQSGNVVPHSTQHLLLKSQVGSLKAEKEEVLNRLHQAHATIELLETENSDLKSEAVKTAAEIKAVKESVQRDQEVITNLHQSHADEISRFTKEARAQLLNERERLLNQIRELTVIKARATAEVDELKESLSEAQDLATTSSTNLERSEVKHKTELEKLKIEMQTLQELYSESEKAHASMLKSNQQSDERIGQLESKNKMLEEKLEILKSSHFEEDSMKLNLRAAEQRISQLQHEKYEAVLAIETKAADDSVKIQVKHRAAVDDLRRQLDNAHSKILSQNQQILHLQDQKKAQRSKDATKREQKSSRQIWSRKKEQSKTTPAPVSARYLSDTVASRNKRCSTVPYAIRPKKLGRSLGAVRSGKSSTASTPPPSPVKKVPFPVFPGGEGWEGEGDMAGIFRMLERDGFSPDGASAEEMMVHLYRINEKAEENLHTEKEERKRMAASLKSVNDKLLASEASAQSSQIVVKQRLKEMLQKTQKAEEETSAMRQKHQQILAENQELKGRLIELRGKLMDKSVQMTQMEADLAGTKRNANYSQKELSIERHQKSVLQSKVSTLETHLVSAKKEMQELEVDAKEKLTTAGDHVKQTREEVAGLKAKIGEMEGEVSNLRQELKQATEQRETLQVQLDSINSHVSLLEAELHKEKTKCREAQSKLASLEGDSQRKKSELDKVVTRNKELQAEIVNYQNKIRASQQNISLLETRLQALQREHASCKAELSNKASSAAEMERRLNAAMADLKRYQEVGRKLQNTISVTKNDLETTTLNLQIEKQNNKELQAMVETLNGNLERSGKKLEGIDVQFAQSKKELMDKKGELQQMLQENHTLRMELKHAQNATAAMQEELEMNHREFTAKARELILTNEKLASMTQKLAIANSDIESYRHQVDYIRAQLCSSETEQSRLANDNKMNESELNTLKLDLAVANKSLAERATELKYAEEQVKTMRRESELLAAELSSAKVTIQTLNNAKTRLQNDLELRSSQIEMEGRRHSEVEQTYQQKLEETQQLQNEIEKLKCCLICEREQNETLTAEHNDTKAKLMNITEKNKKLQEDLDKFMEDSHSKSDENQSMIVELQDKVSITTDQLELLKGQYDLLDAEDKRAKQLLETVSKEYAEMKGKLTLTNSELESTNTERDNLQKQVEMLKEELDKASSALSHKTSSHEQTANKLALIQAQLSCALQESEKQRSCLDIEHTNCIQLKGEIQMLNDKLLSANVDMEHIMKERDHEKKRAESLATENSNLQANNQQLHRNLCSVQAELADQKESSIQARDDFTQNIAMLRSTHEEEKAAWKAENESLRREQAGARQQIAEMEKTHDASENKLAVITAKLANAEENCTQLETNLAAITEAHGKLETQHLKLETSHIAIKAQISDTRRQSIQQTSELERLQHSLKNKELEIESLSEKLQVQRESAASSLNRIQQQSNERSTDLHAKIQQLSDQVKEAHEALRSAQQDVVKVKAEKATVTACLNEESDKNRVLRDRIQEQLTAVRLLEQQIEQLRKADEHEKNTKVQLQHTLSEEMRKRQMLESQIGEQKESINTTEYELAECRKFLNKECGNNSHLKQELERHKEDLRMCQSRIESMKSMQKESQSRGEADMHELKQKHQTEKRLLKERIKELQGELEESIAMCKAKADEAVKVVASNKILAEDHKEASKRLGTLEQKYQDKKDECNGLKMKLQAAELQIVRYQTEINVLEKAKLEMEEQKKKSDAKQRKEMQKVLAEVTDHMEQQYSAHKYLERLRSDNETVALKEKERVIGHLKDELKFKKQETKQDRLRMEQMQVEASFLKNQQKDRDKSRRRLEDRLEQVSATLNRTLPHPGLETSVSQIPVTSTPMHPGGSRLTRARHSIGL